MPVVTVLVPVRDEERYVQRVLWCIRRQTVSDHEVLFVDDGSTDDTVPLLHRASRRDARVRVIETGGVGLSNALGIGLEESRTALVARLDADDLSLPRRLELSLAELARNPRAVAVGTYGARVNQWNIPVGLLRTGPASPQEYREWRAQGRVINLTHSSVTYRRDEVRAVGGYPAQYRAAMDLALWSRLAERGEMYAIPRLLTIYTIRQDSISTANLTRQELAVRRVVVEQRLGRRFMSAGEFEQHMAADPDVDWDTMRAGIERKVARRAFGRQLASGQPLRALRTGRETGEMWSIVRQTLRRAVGGR